MNAKIQQTNLSIFSSRYQCLNLFSFKSLVPNVQVSSIEGSFGSDGKTYTDVDAIVIKQAKVTYIPDFTAANKKFPNLKKTLYCIMWIKIH